MWFILFLFPSYPNLNYKKEPSPTLSHSHSIVSLAKAWSLLKIAASVQLVAVLFFWWRFLVAVLFWWRFLAAVLSPVAVTFTWRLLHFLAGFFVLDECHLLLWRQPLPIEEEPLPERVPLPALRVLCAEIRVPLLSWRVLLPVERYHWLPREISVCNHGVLLLPHLDCSLLWVSPYMP